MNTNKNNPQRNFKICLKRYFEYDDLLKYVLYNFFVKVGYKKSQLERNEIKKSIQEFINICSHVPFQVDEFDKETQRFPINLELFEKLDLCQVASIPFYASLFFVLNKAMFLEKMWEIRVIDTLVCKKNDTCCKKNDTRCKKKWHPLQKKWHPSN